MTETSPTPGPAVPPKGPSTRTVAVLVGGVVVVLAVTFGLILAFGPDDDGSGSDGAAPADGPESAITGLAEAAQSADCEALKTVWPSEHQGECADIVADYESLDSVTVDRADVVSEDGDEASVEAVVVFEGTGPEGQPITIRDAGVYALSVTDGAWQISGYEQIVEDDLEQ